MINVVQAALAALSGKAVAAAAGVSAAALAVSGVAVSTPDEANEGLGTATEQVESLTDETLEDEGELTIADEGKGAEKSSKAEAGDRSVAEDVHAMLSGNHRRPGDEGFGQAVANNARTNGGGQFGQSVANTASGGRSGGKQAEAAADTDDVNKRPEGAGRPEGVSARGR